MQLRTLLLALVVIVFNVVGNLALSLGMKTAVLQDSVAGYVRILFTPLVAVGVVLLILWMLSRMALLSKADLSYVLPVTSLGYVLSAVAGRVFLHEQISPSRWAGTLFIAAGIVLVGMTNPRTPATQEIPQEIRK